jgi:hypothetical protein
MSSISSFDISCGMLPISFNIFSISIVVVTSFGPYQQTSTRANSSPFFHNPFINYPRIIHEVDHYFVINIGNLVARAFIPLKMVGKIKIFNFFTKL